MFASRTVVEHILRGGLGVSALWYAIAITEAHPWGSLAVGVFALLSFRGCPICWTIGLFETVIRKAPLNRLSRRSRVSP